MVEQNSKNRLTPEQYSRLKAEIKAPYRGLRKFIYLGLGASGFIGSVVFMFRCLAGKEIASSLANFALQLGVVALMIFLWRREENQQQEP
ncbi:MAG: DUF3493 domain-containing protein [Mastigocoleus sp. MO_167.B18]|uniref:DUF3493 domain-containing protein n=1 Tax=Mastigocoleus sp. MO_188.B34 TaxID=3036635 RepID=UPI002627D7ED|nr:DUF3493 domain-containing protein [Mastigocoleus sp. MO_188.B34]MDJ0694700.1 DUF3493 domain-containing protein [Mastigocoleus sp. MO_188.B34]MDJ0773973.1 DUF3493 domain-containing protein [Mastigocoleus sp. MO_167.B18]